MDESDIKLMELQKKLFQSLEFKIDLYREEGKGVIVVPHGATLTPRNVIYAIPDYRFLNMKI